jgi:glycosyltransferase involved in cell wall biosynthesis
MLDLALSQANRTGKYISDCNMIRIIAPMGSRSYFGAERANIDLLYRLQQQGAAVLCLVRHEDWPENIALREILTQRGLAWEKVPFPEYPSSRYWRYWPKVAIETLWRYFSLNQRSIELAKKWGATHLHLFNPFQAASLYTMINRTNIKIVFRSGEKPIIHNLFYRKTWQWLQEQNINFVAESEYLSDSLNGIGISKKSIEVIRTPPPLRTTPGASHTQALNHNKPGINFIYIGQIAEFKGISHLIKAFRIVLNTHNDAFLLICGPIDSEWAHSIATSCSDLIDLGRVEFAGMVEDVPEALAKCDVHVAPSLKPEGYGLVAVEAKQASLPSIVYKLGGLGELVLDEVEGIALTERTPEALARAMLRYCDDPLRARTDGIRAHVSLTERLHVDLHDEAWQKIYTRSIG